jgi:hypothetical protein
MSDLYHTTFNVGGKVAYIRQSLRSFSEPVQARPFTFNVLIDVTLPPPLVRLVSTVGCTDRLAALSNIDCITRLVSGASLARVGCATA